MATHTTEAATHSLISIRPDLTQEVLSNAAKCLSPNNGDPLFDVLWAGFLLSSIASLILFAWRIIRFRFPCITIPELKSEEDQLNEIWNIGIVGNSFRGEEREYIGHQHTQEGVSNPRIKPQVRATERWWTYPPLDTAAPDISC